MAKLFIFQTNLSGMLKEEYIFGSTTIPLCHIRNKAPVSYIQHKILDNHVVGSDECSKWTKKQIKTLPHSLPLFNGQSTEN